MMQRAPRRDPLVSDAERAHIIDRLWRDFFYDPDFLKQADDRDLISWLSAELNGLNP